METWIFLCFCAFGFSGWFCLMHLLVFSTLFYGFIKLCISITFTVNLPIMFC
jgi:hypothetical protein